MLTFKKLDKKKLLLYFLIIVAMVVGAIIILYRNGIFVGSQGLVSGAEVDTMTTNNIQLNNINVENFKIFDNPIFKGLKETVVEKKNYVTGNKDPFNSIKKEVEQATKN